MVDDYDLVVIGSGAGTYCAARGASAGMDVALIEEGIPGGTCPNTGCIPSKMLIYPADVLVAARDASLLGVDVRVERIDADRIFGRMREERARRQDVTRTWIEETEGLDFFAGRARFTPDGTLAVNNRTVAGRHIVIATGARPAVPPVRGIGEVQPLTNESVLELRALPETLIIIGGGYIAMEYGHFFSAMGTGVTILQRNDRILPDEEPDVSAVLLHRMQRRMRIETGIEVRGVRRDGGDVVVTGALRKDGRETEYTASTVMIATGRASNADRLDPGAAGIATDARGYIVADDRLETSRPGVWAVGDANGRSMFRHTANREVRCAWQNIVHGKACRMRYDAIPHAVYSYPPVASVGITEARAREQGAHVTVARVPYSATAKGIAMGEREGFAQAVAERGSGRILGFAIIGPQAPVLIQEVACAMERNGTVHDIIAVTHIHPALPEVVQKTAKAVIDAEKGSRGRPGFSHTYK